MNNTWCAVYMFVEDWQTLLAALIALIAALRTIKVMRQQSSAESQRHQDQMHRKEMAARAEMPDALSELCTYTNEVGRFLTNRVEVPPAAPETAIPILKRAIEYIEGSAAERTFELVSWYQVHRARLTSNNWTNDLPDAQYDVVLLQAYVNSLFDYARNEEATAPVQEPSQEEMTTATRNVFELTYLVSHRHEFEELQATIERRHS